MKRKQTTSKASRRKKKPASPRKDASPAEAPSPRFLDDLAARGEAAELTPAGKLPQKKTHAITEKNPDGSIKTVKRGRFYLTG